MLYARRALAMFASLAFFSCGESPAGPSPPPAEDPGVTGNVEVMVVTTGVIPSSSDCFRCSLDNDSGVSVSPNGVTLIRGLSPGIHWIGLKEIPASCVVSGRNPRPVNVSMGRTNLVVFEVWCPSSGHRAYDLPDGPK